MPRKLVLPNDQSLIGGEAQRRLSELDPDLLLTHHRVTGWQVFREESDERGTFYRKIAQQTNPTAKLDIDQLVAGLRARDTQLAGRSHVDQMEEHLRDVLADDQRREDAAADALRPVYDRMAYYAAKDSGDLSITIAPGSWKDRVS